MGIPDYEAKGAEVGRLVSEKAAAYGDAFTKAGDVLALMYPNGVAPEHYTDMLCIVRILDKLFRLATRKDAFGESPYADLVGYGLLGLAKDEEVANGR
jgi:hypothetical protein